jgi:hypothetical protein
MSQGDPRERLPQQPVTGDPGKVRLADPLSALPIHQGRSSAHELAHQDLDRLRRDLLATLDRCDALGADAPQATDAPGFEAAADAAIEATTALLDYEDRLPLLLDAPRHRLSVRLVRAAGWLAVGVAVLLAMLLLVRASPQHWWSWLWLVPLLGMLAGGGLAVRAAVHPPGGEHVRQRIGALLLLGAVALAPLAVLGALGAWAVLPWLVLLVLGPTIVIRNGPQT